MGALVAAGLMVASTRADARVVQDERYGFDVTWNAAVRLIRVDMGFTITERDRDTGFVMFSYTDAGGHATPGSVELIRTRVDGVDGCRVVITVPRLPTYVERHLVTRLERKLHEEYGEPAVAPRTPPTQTPGPGSSGDGSHGGDGSHDGDRDRDRDRDRPRDGESAGSRERERDGDRDRERSREGSGTR